MLSAEGSVAANDWRWITGEGGLAKTSVSLETLRTGSRESRAEKGPCAYRHSDNLWLPVNQASSIPYT